MLSLFIVRVRKCQNAYPMSFGPFSEFQNKECVKINVKNTITPGDVIPEKRSLHTVESTVTCAQASSHRPDYPLQCFLCVENRDREARWTQAQGRFSI